MPDCQHRGASCVVGNFYTCPMAGCPNGPEVKVTIQRTQRARRDTLPAFIDIDEPLYSWGSMAVAYSAFELAKLGLYPGGKCGGYAIYLVEPEPDAVLDRYGREGLELPHGRLWVPAGG